MEHLGVSRNCLIDVSEELIAIGLSLTAETRDAPGAVLPGRGPGAWREGYIACNGG